MNETSIFEEIDDWFVDMQTGNLGAAFFIIAYIGFYGLGIICLFAQQLKETQRQRHELPAYFLKTLWDVPNKNKLYEELADVERLKRIFRGYFADHESYTTIGSEDLQAIVDERAHACALKYRQKLRHLHLSHTDYYLDTAQRLLDDAAAINIQEQLSKSVSLARTSIKSISIMNENYNRNDCHNHMMSVSVV